MSNFKCKVAKCLSTLSCKQTNPSKSIKITNDNEVIATPITKNTTITI